MLVKDLSASCENLHQAVERLMVVTGLNVDTKSDHHDIGCSTCVVFSIATSGATHSQPGQHTS